MLVLNDADLLDQSTAMFHAVKTGKAVDFTEEKFLRKLLQTAFDERINTSE